MSNVKVWIDDGKCLGHYCFTTDVFAAECEPDRNWQVVEVSHEQLERWMAVTSLQMARENELARWRADEDVYPQDVFVNEALQS
jgi:hypothetical protein